MATINSINNASAPFGCTGDLTITTGNLKIPTTSSTVGQIMINAVPVFHTYGGATNVFVGTSAGNFTFNTTNATKNTAVGNNALHAIAGASATSTDSRNVAIGYGALRYLAADAADTFGCSNTCVGTEACGYNWTGGGFQYNVFIGDGAGGKVGSNNVGVGYQTLMGGGNGNIVNHTALGYQAGKSLSTSSNGCTMLGYSSGTAYVGSESYNICIGHGVVGTAAESHKLRIGLGTGTGTSQLDTAYISGIYTTAATPSGTAKATLVDSNNVIYGLTNTASALLHVAAAGTAPIWSTGPTITGTMTAATFDTGVAAAKVTLSGTTLAASGSDTDISITLTPKGTGTVVSAAVYSKAVGGTNRAMLVDDSGLIGNATSSRKFKDNITDMGSDSSPIMKLRPVSFTYKSDPDGHVKQGLIAEEVAEIMPSLVSYDEHHHPYTVSYHELPAMLLNEIQKLERRIRELEARLDAKEIQ